MVEIQESLAGVMPFFLYFVPAIAIVMVFMYVFTKMTSYDEVALVKENNAAASIVYVGSMLGFALPIASAAANAVSLLDFAVWVVIAAVVQLVTYQVFKRFYPKIDERVEKGEIAASLKLAGVAVMVGMLNAASMTY